MPDDLISEHYKVGSQLHKSFGVREGKEKRVRFVERELGDKTMRSDQEIRRIFSHEGVGHRDPRTGKLTSGLTKKEYQHYINVLQPQKQAHKAITKAVAKGANVTDHHDAFFNSIAGSAARCSGTA